MPVRIHHEPIAGVATTGKRAKYRGLTQADSLVWSAFLQQYQSSLENIVYNVAVGQWVPPTGGQLIISTRIPTELLAKRIDVVAYWAGTWSLFEVKPRINPAAIGQVQVYLEGWRYTYPTLPVPVPVIVYALQDVDCERAALRAGIRMAQVNVPAADFVEFGYRL